MLKSASKVINILILVFLVFACVFSIHYYSFLVIFAKCRNFDGSCVSEASYHVIDYGANGVILSCNLVGDEYFKADCYKNALKGISERGRKEDKAQKICQAIPQDVKDKYYDHFRLFCEPVIFVTHEIDEKTVEVGESFDIQMTVKNEGKIFETRNMILELSPSFCIKSEESLKKDISGIPPGGEKEVVWTIELTDKAQKNFWITGSVKYGKNFEFTGPEGKIFIHTKHKIIVDGKEEEIKDIDFPLTKEEASLIIKKFCEPKGYEYEYSDVVFETDEQRKATKWKFPVSKDKFLYYGFVDVKTGTTECFSGREVKNSNFEIVGVDEETGWKIARSNNYGFEIKFPPFVSPSATPSGSYIVRRSWTSLPRSNNSKGETIVSFVTCSFVNIPPEDPDHSFTSELRIGVSSDQKEVRDCLNFWGLPSTNVNIGGREFKKFELHDTAAGHRITVSVYRMIYDNICFSIEKLEYGRLYDEIEDLRSSHYNYEYSQKFNSCRETVEQIFSTFKFFKKTQGVPFNEFPNIKKPEKVVEEEIIRSLIQEFYEMLEQRENAKGIMTSFTSPQTPEEKESYDWLIGTDIGAPRLFMKVKISNPSIKEIQQIEEKEFKVIATDQFQSWSNVAAQWSDPIDRDVYFIVVKVGDKWLIDKYVDANPNIIYRTDKYSGFGHEEIIAGSTN